jgi:hypothetical protein
METTTAIKDEVKQMIEMEDNPEVLQSIKELLSPPLDPILKEKLISRTLKSFADFDAGRLLTREEVSKRIHKIIFR